MSKTKLLLHCLVANKYTKTYEGNTTYVLQFSETAKNGKLNMVDVKVTEPVYEKAEINKEITIPVTISAYVAGDRALISYKEAGL